MNSEWRATADHVMRVLFTLSIMCASFVIVFLAIFVPLLLWAEHVAPHDGQGGMGAFFIGCPAAAWACLISIPFSYRWALKRVWFERGIEVKETT